MKSSYLLTVCALIGTCSLILAQDKKIAAPKTWKERAIARFSDTPKPDQKALIEAAMPKASAKPKKERKILVFWRCEGYIHTSIPFGNYALEKMASSSRAFSVNLADSYDVFTPANLAQYDGLLFNSTTHLTPNKEQQKAILDFVNSGKGIIGIHAASDSFAASKDFSGWDEGIALIGGIFNGHPWAAGGKWAFKLDDPGHKINAAFKGKGFWHRDEIYWYKPESFQGREKLRVLLSLDMSKGVNLKRLANGRYKDVVKGDKKNIDVPVSWIRDIGKGRLFYTNLGHRDDTFWNQTILQHMLDGIQYALGDLDADASPSASVKNKPALAPLTPAE